MSRHLLYLAIRHTLAVSILLSVTVNPASAVQTGKVISWDEGNKHVGETIIVCGPVAFADRIELTRNSAAMILGGEPVDRSNAFRDERRFKVVFLDYHEGFHQDITERYLGKDVCVIGTIIWAMAGGVEILPMTPSQVAFQGDSPPTMPQGTVADLPSGALSFEEARDHIDETRTVCGVAVGVRTNVPRNKTLNMDYEIPDSARARMPEGTVFWADERVKHRVVIGDFSRFEVLIPVEKAGGLPDDIPGHFLNKEMCATGKLEYTPAMGASITIEDLDNIAFLR